MVTARELVKAPAKALEVGKLAFVTVASIVATVSNPFISHFFSLGKIRMNLFFYINISTFRSLWNFLPSLSSLL